MNESPFRISGQERREKKKELSSLKSYVKNFWHYEDIERVYGGGSDDARCRQMIANAEEEIRLLETQLSETAASIKRDRIIIEILNTGQ